MRPAFILSALAVIVPALGAPTLIPITKRAGPYKQDSYVITFKDRASKSAAVEALKQKFAEPGSQSTLTYDYTVFDGVAVLLAKPEMLFWAQTLTGIESIEQDQIMSINYETGIDGLSTVDDGAASAPAPHVVGRADGGPEGGEGVTVYGIDTGIYTEHHCFGGRATWGKTFGGYPDKDGNGHGTHTAGTVVGTGIGGDKDYGLATKAKIIAVKVLGDDGSGALSDVSAGVNWAFQHFSAAGTGKGVATMSLGGLATPNDPLGKAVAGAIRGGLHFTVAAGNDNKPAEGASPANVESANTIGAVDSKNQKASFSNYGKLIDVWAPGVNIKSAWIGSETAVNTISGTSMATPFVAGILAVALGKNPMDPATASKELQAHAKPEVTFGPTDLAAQVTSNNLRAYPW